MIHLPFRSLADGYWETNFNHRDRAIVKSQTRTQYRG